MSSKRKKVDDEGVSGGDLSNNAANNANPSHPLSERKFAKTAQRNPMTISPPLRTTTGTIHPPPEAYYNATNSIATTTAAVNYPFSGNHLLSGSVKPPPPLFDRGTSSGRVVPNNHDSSSFINLDQQLNDPIEMKLANACQDLYAQLGTGHNGADPTLILQALLDVDMRRQKKRNPYYPLAAGRPTDGVVVTPASVQIVANPTIHHKKKTESDDDDDDDDDSATSGSKKKKNRPSSTITAPFPAKKVNFGAAVAPASPPPTSAAAAAAGNTTANNQKPVPAFTFGETTSATGTPPTVGFSFGTTTTTAAPAPTAKTTTTTLPGGGAFTFGGASSTAAPPSSALFSFAPPAARPVVPPPPSQPNAAANDGGGGGDVNNDNDIAPLDDPCDIGIVIEEGWKVLQAFDRTMVKRRVADDKKWVQLYIGQLVVQQQKDDDNEKPKMTRLVMKNPTNTFLNMVVEAKPSLRAGSKSKDGIIIRGFNNLDDEQAAKGDQMIMFLLLKPDAKELYDLLLHTTH